MDYKSRLEKARKRLKEMFFVDGKWAIDPHCKNCEHWRGNIDPILIRCKTKGSAACERILGRDGADAVSTPQFDFWTLKTHGLESPGALPIHTDPDYGCIHFSPEISFLKDEVSDE